VTGERYQAGLPDEAAAEQLIQGIEVHGLDVDAELDRLDGLPSSARASTITEYQLAALAARIERTWG
jgi:hypothetical protein